MGNFASCYFPDKRTKLFDADGGLKLLKITITAAELMLETPGHVVCDIESLVKSRRIVALRADDELVMGGVYMLVEANRLNCVVSELEIAIIESACTKKLFSGRRGGGCCNKVLPDKDNKATATTASGDQNGCGRSGGVRPWSPVLEPIAEVC
ncbi:hypothetical protein QQ045_027921 [Rhodiola kirilowii]